MQARLPAMLISIAMLGCENAPSQMMSTIHTPSSLRRYISQNASRSPNAKMS